MTNAPTPWSPYARYRIIELDAENNVRFQYHYTDLDATEAFEQWLRDTFSADAVRRANYCIDARGRFTLSIRGDKRYRGTIQQIGE